MPTSWSSVLLVVAIALAVAGAAAWIVGVIGAVAFAIEVTTDLGAAMRSER